MGLSVGEAFGRQVGEHLMAEQVRVNRLRHASLLAIALHNFAGFGASMGRRPPGGI